MTCSWRNSTPGLEMLWYEELTAARVCRPKRISSFENPKMNESFWSTRVTRTSPANDSASRVVSSSPPNPAPRINTCCMTPEHVAWLTSAHAES